MNARIPCFLGTLGLAILATALPAAAKNINMPSFSRSAVEAACHRAGGASYGVREQGQPYGCTTQHGRVDCSPEAECSGYVSDLVPLPASSLDAVLGAGVHAGPIKIGASERRISPVVTQP